MSVQAQDCIDIEQIKTDLSNIADQCSCSTPLVLGVPNETTDISTYQLGISVQNECIEVYGTLVIDQVIYFENCDFIFDDGALIRVNNFVEIVSFVECNLQSCGTDLWNGIEIGNWTNLIFRENIMRHSYNGIHGNNGPMFAFLIDNVFNDNKVVVNLGDPTHLQRKSEISLLGNIFAQTNDLKDHWSFGPLTGVDGLTLGVRANNARVNANALRSPCNHRNIFLQLYGGYFLRNSESTIRANVFHDFRDEVVPGFGISAQGFQGGSSTLRQEGWPTSHISTFDNVAFAIQTTRTATEIKGNIIKECRQGIRVLAPQFKNQILSNDIEASHYGIRVEGNTDPLMRVNKNKIEIEVSASVNYSYGIEVAYYRNPVSLGEIRENEVTINSANLGILMINAINHQLSCNEIQIDETADEYTSGIEVRGGYLNRIAQNEVSGNYSSTSADEVNAIKIIESERNTIRINELENTITGLHFSNLNNNTRQERNVFRNHDVGYYIDPSGVTGWQFYVANKSLGSYADWGALNESVPLQSLYIDYSNLTSTECWPETINPIDDWFFTNPFNTGDCDAPTFTECPRQGEPETELLSRVDSLIARGEFYQNDFNNRRVWQSERYLYRKLEENPSMISACALMDSFWTDAQTSTIKAYHDLRVLIDEYSSHPDTLLENWVEYDSLYQLVKEDAIEVLEDWLEYPDSLELLELVLEYFPDMDSLWVLSSGQYSDWRTSSLTDLESLLTDIQSLSVPNVYAGNERMVMQAIVRLDQGLDSISSTLQGNLTSLAEGCIVEEGPSLFMAGVMMGYIDEEIVTYEAYCQSLGFIRRVDPSLIGDQSIQLCPNPSSGELTVKFSVIPQSESKMSVYNVAGQKLYNALIPGGIEQQLILLPDLPEGHYIFKLENADHSFTHPLIILK